MIGPGVSKVGDWPDDKPSFIALLEVSPALEVRRTRSLPYVHLCFSLYFSVLSPSLPFSSSFDFSPCFSFPRLPRLIPRRSQVLELDESVSIQGQQTWQHHRSDSGE